MHLESFPAIRQFQASCFRMGIADDLEEDALERRITWMMMLVISIMLISKSRILIVH